MVVPARQANSHSTSVGRRHPFSQCIQLLQKLLSAAPRDLGHGQFWVPILVLAEIRIPHDLAPHTDRQLGLSQIEGTPDHPRPLRFIPVPLMFMQWRSHGVGATRNQHEDNAGGDMSNPFRKIVLTPLITESLKLPTELATKGRDRELLLDLRFGFLDGGQRRRLRAATQKKRAEKQ